MSLVVNTNIGSLNAQRSLATSGNELRTAMERLSSGKKINSAADDAAGFAIAERMTAQIRGLEMATKNTNDGLSMLSVIENAAGEVTDILHRIRELAVQSANDTNSDTDRQYLQKEVESLVEEIDRVTGQTSFNEQKVLTGFFNNKAIQVGTDTGQKISLSVSSLKSSTLGIATGFGAAAKLTALDNSTLTASGSRTEVDLSSYSGSLNDIGHVVNHDNYFGSSWGFGTPNATYQAQKAFVSFEDGSSYALSEFYPGGSTLKIDASLSDIQAKKGQQWMVSGGGVSQVDLSTANGASNALGTVTAAIEQVANQRAELGALQNRLEYTVSNLMTVSEFTSAARSRIEDADFAVESARLSRAQVLQQTGTAMLAQANVSSQLAISLIR